MSYMSKICFTEEIVHFSPKRGLEEIIANRLSRSSDFAAPDRRSYAWDLSLGKCLKKFPKFCSESDEEANKIIENHYAETMKVDYVNAGQKGYFTITSIFSTNRKRGQKYYVATEIEQKIILTTLEKYRRVSFYGYETKKEAINAAIKYALSHLDEKVAVINEKGQCLGTVFLQIKFYNSKPKFVERDYRIVVPAYVFKYAGTCYVG